MNSPSNTQLLMRPLICFGLIVVSGVIGYGHAVLTKNGFFLIGFLIPYIPFSLAACAMGTVFAVKAYRGLPPKHQGRMVLTTAIALAVLVLATFLLLLRNVYSISRP